ncbi:MAG: arylsulfotransferase family protein [Haloarculaceae archaeon]
MNVDIRKVRIALLVTVVVLFAPLAVDFATSGGSTPANGPVDANGTLTPVSPDWNGTATPVSSVGDGSGPGETPPDSSGGGEAAESFEATGHLAYVVDATGPGQLTVVDRATGKRIFSTAEHELYHDVDPSPAGEFTLTYVASNIRGKAACPDRLETPCAQNVVDRINYSTGEVERVYTRYVNYNGSSNTHDVDRISATEYLVGDIQHDRVFVLNVTTDEVEWVWNASAEFDRSTGGQPGDWTHLNDVEVVDEGLYMVNLRNQDQVVFVDRQRGMLENWTLGAEDEYGTLYEQHNPDYIPRENGGPAVLVSDSENNRVVEYQRRNGTWTRTWLWTDERLQWPRDADRLPNGNTLVTDTHGTRVIEVSPNGSILWSRTVPRAVYEAELLTTGPESEGGPSMARIHGNVSETKVSDVDGPGETLQKWFLEAFHPLVLHGFLYVLPTWVSPLAGGTLLVALVIVVLWALGEGGRFAYLRYRGGD